MSNYTDKSQENKNQILANGVTQKQDNKDSRFQFVDNRPEAAAQRKLQERASNSPHMSQLKSFQNMANHNSQAKQITQLQRAQQKQDHVTNTPTVQLQKPNGAYRAKKGANLRNDDANHGSVWKLPEDYGAYVIDKGNRVSNFKAGWVTNEHSWVTIEDENNEATGWIEDSKLISDNKLLQDHFRPGDKLYGRYEARRNVTRSRRPENNTIRTSAYNIVDDVNDEMGRTRTGEGSAEVERFRNYTGQHTKRPRGDKQDLINQFCKQALVHYTNLDHTIHFMLDGISPDVVVRETKANRNSEDFEYDDESLGAPRVTGIELRALMRAAMRAKGLTAAKTDGEGHDIDLTKVKFYLNNVVVDAPWAAKANSEWGQAWLQYKQGKGV